MRPKLYHALADWWHVMSAPAEYAEEAGLYREALERHARRPIEALLELGSGGGNNASHLKARFRLTLVDLAPGMIAQSQRINPECAHHVGDMRDVRLEQTFDAVLIHDAICYMRTEADLRAALATAFVHCAPGGVAAFVPDDTLETFEPYTDHGGHDAEDGRAMRYLEWTGFAADGQTPQTIFALVLRDSDGTLQTIEDVHTFGLFSRETWLRLIAEVGFEARAVPYNHSEFDSPREFFIGVRPEL